MPTFKHGKQSRVLLGSVDASSFLNDMTLDHAVDANDVTCYGAEDRSYLGSQRGGKFDFSGFLDTIAGTSDVLNPLTSVMGTTSNVIVTAMPGAAVTASGVQSVSPGARARLFLAANADIGKQAPALGVVTIKTGGMVNGPMDYGVTLHGPSSARSSTFAATSVNSGVAAGTTNGGVAHLHVTQASTLTTLVVKVQHSSAAAVWSDLITFTSTSTGAQRSTVAGTIKRYTRATATTLSGGAGKSVKFVCAFARRGTIR